MSPDFGKALELTRDLPETASNLTRVSKEVGSELARQAFAQWGLRRRASTKFLKALEMLFEGEALEQATHEKVAAYHAGLFPKGCAVIDLTCGIGADTIALAGRGPVSAFELDGARLEFARHNLGVYDRTAELHLADAMGRLRELVDGYVYADPSRRVGGRRTLDPGDFSPDPVEVARLGGRQRLCVIKLSPLLSDEFLEGLGVRVEFVSFGRECREALVFTGREAVPGRVAVHVESGELLPAGEVPPVTEVPGAFLFDVDPAAVRAHALGVLCRTHGMCGLADSGGYLAGPEPVSSPWMRGYRVLYEGPGDVKRTKAELRRLGSGTPILKQRGTGLDLDALRKQFKLEGSWARLVAIYPRGRGIRHVVMEEI